MPLSGNIFSFLGKISVLKDTTKCNTLCRIPNETERMQIFMHLFFSTCSKWNYGDNVLFGTLHWSEQYIFTPTKFWTHLFIILQLTPGHQASSRSSQQDFVQFLNYCIFSSLNILAFFRAFDQYSLYLKHLNNFHLIRLSLLKNAPWIFQRSTLWLI